MHPIVQFPGEQPVDGAMAVDARAAREGRGDDAHAKMRLAAGTRPGVAGVFGGLVENFEKMRRKLRAQLRFDLLFHAHEISDSTPPRRRLGLPLAPLAPNLFWMNLNSPLFDRIRMKTSPESQPEEHQARCDYPGCGAAGEHRAPMGRLREGQYFCFCLEHVRAYNQSYNYFSGMSDSDVAKFQRDAETGHRPTWKMGVNRAAREAEASAGADPVGSFPFGRRPRPEPAPRPRYGLAALKALETLGLDERADAEGMKARYKELVKRLHPDANGGDRSSEDRLREIIHAYNYLRSAKLA